MYISPTSTEDKLRGLYEEVSSAVDEGLLTDATGRNALYKIHVSLGKIVNALDAQDKMANNTMTTASRRSVSRGASVAPSVVSTVGKEEEDDDGATVVGTALEDVVEEEDGDGDTVVRRGDEDSLVDELLTDDDEV